MLKKTVRLLESIIADFFTNYCSKKRILVWQAIIVTLIMLITLTIGCFLVAVLVHHGGLPSSLKITLIIAARLHHLSLPGPCRFGGLLFNRVVYQGN